jgi:hypothetical protein
MGYGRQATGYSQKNGSVDPFSCARSMPQALRLIPPSCRRPQTVDLERWLQATGYRLRSEARIARSELWRTPRAAGRMLSSFLAPAPSLQPPA